MRDQVAISAYRTILETPGLKKMRGLQGAMFLRPEQFLLLGSAISLLCFHVSFLWQQYLSFAGVGKRVGGMGEK